MKVLLTSIDVIRARDELVHESGHLELPLLLLGIVVLALLVTIGDVLLKEAGHNAVDDLHIEKDE